MACRVSIGSKQMPQVPGETALVLTRHRRACPLASLLESASRKGSVKTGPCVTTGGDSGGSNLWSDADRRAPTGMPLPSTCMVRGPAVSAVSCVRSNTGAAVGDSCAPVVGAWLATTAACKLPSCGITSAITESASGDPGCWAEGGNPDRRSASSAYRWYSRHACCVRNHRCLTRQRIGGPWC